MIGAWEGEEGGEGEVHTTMSHSKFPLHALNSTFGEELVKLSKEQPGPAWCSKKKKPIKSVIPGIYRFIYER